jgi:hypothetical protein
MIIAVALPQSLIVMFMIANSPALAPQRFVLLHVAFFSVAIVVAVAVAAAIAAAVVVF